MFAKMSVVLFLLRLLKGGSHIKLHKIILYSSSVLMIIANVFGVFIILGHCFPANKTWEPEVEGTCEGPALLDIGGRTVAGKLFFYSDTHVRT